MGSHSLDAPPVPRLICTLWLTRLLIGSKVLRHPRREGCNSRNRSGADPCPLGRAPQQGFVAFDRAYLKKLRNGDPATALHFFEYFEKLLNLKLRAQAVRSDMEDLPAETFIRVITALRRGGEVREPERFGAFVNSVCN